MSGFSVPLHLEERHGLRRASEAVRIGVPLPQGLLRESAEIVVTDSGGARVPHQAMPLAFWSDRSVKWLLVDALATLEPFERATLFLRPQPAPRGDSGPRLRVTARSGAIDVDTGVARFEIQEQHSGPFSSVTMGAVSLLRPLGSQIRLTDRDTHTFEPTIERLTIEEQGPVRAVVMSEGRFQGPRGDVPLRFTSRAVFVAGSACVSLDFQVRNTRAAAHPGGLWDLGDRGSCFFQDLTLSLLPHGPVEALRWYSEQASSERVESGEPWSIYQDSSGGENWDSPNHVDQHAKPTVTFRGYRVFGTSGGQEIQIAEGHRASPCVTVESGGTWIAASTMDFWQNFPKALRWHDGMLSVGLFPGETSCGFELQGGEQKRHTVWLDFGSVPDVSRIQGLQHPVAAWIDPKWVEASSAILWLTAEARGGSARYADYVHQIVEGPHSFVAKREIIDEYGWRNFGDLYADHEAVNHEGPQPFVSHYNNQYDFIYGAFVQYQRSGDSRWRQLMAQAARHVIDIDIYHTQEDKAAFNGGLFWHTDHYLPAASCTHRTYSRSNGATGYGGGPSNEHNYTSGLLHYYYLTGDPEAALTVRELADWVLGLDDGARTLFGLIDGGPTGGASRTLEASYHRPGRGAGNSINALLDAYELSRERMYLTKAEELIQRCVHPADDIAALSLDDPEHRWSYLVFLQVLCKYLAKKREIGETDYGFHYGRESLLHYADWMADNEVPYKDVLHKVELPTETWPAHDVRKSHVLHVAAQYCAPPQCTRLHERASFFFERCLTDLLSFKTAYVTRPLVILCVFGSIEDYFRHTNVTFEESLHNHAFGSPAAFIPQRARLRSSMTSKQRVLASELGRVVKDVLHDLRSRMRRAG